MRHAVELFAAWVEWRSLQRASILPAPLVGADRTRKPQASAVAIDDTKVHQAA
jgi:hypothetical protein